LACQDEFFVNNPLDVKENYENSLPFALLFTCLAFSGLGEFGLSMYGSCFLPLALILSLSVSPSLFFWRIEQTLVLFLCQIHREITPG
jgi:hypothetical protein